MPANPVPDSQVLATLKSTFGFTSFRPLQADIVRSVLGGQDVFVVMPTGGGKSLCYQLPALLLDGLTVVVSPLIALMKDQVDALQAQGVAATFINSSLDPAETNRRLAAVARRAVKLLYVAPERLVTASFLQLLSSSKVALFAIDEAHCISEWGHDFRPEYRLLNRLREAFPDASFGAFTATATRRVQADITAQLSLQKAAGFLGSYDRANLFYEVRPKRLAYGQLVEYLNRRRQASGIIYCQARAETERLSERLRSDGFNAAAYHAGLESDERRQRQEAFKKDNVRIIVATIAFGLGIDKPDVRFVVHYDLPKSLEGYYQESGRAGRDGDPSDCILFYSYGDVLKYRRFIDEKPSEKERQIAHQQLRQMADWASSTECRRRSLLAYFDETLEGHPPPCCDNCRMPSKELDYTEPTKMLLSCAKRTGEQFGTGHLIDVLRGSRSQRVLSLGHDRLTVYGIGRGRSRTEWEFIVRELLRHGYARQREEEFNVLKVTEMGRAVLFKGQQVLLVAPSEDEDLPAGLSALRHDLFEELRAIRKNLADDLGLPPYVIFHDKTLRQMAETLPTNQAQLLRIEGVGHQKAMSYGNLFLDAIAEYVRRTGVEPTPIFKPVGAPGRRVGLTPSMRQTLDRFNEGQTPAEIAAGRGLALSTIEGHMVEALEAGEPLDIKRLVSEDKVRTIGLAIAEVGADALKPIMERLGEGYTYGEVRIVRAFLNQSQARPEIIPLPL